MVYLDGSRRFAAPTGGKPGVPQPRPLSADKAALTCPCRRSSYFSGTWGGQHRAFRAARPRGLPLAAAAIPRRSPQPLPANLSRRDRRLLRCLRLKMPAEGAAAGAADGAWSRPRPRGRPEGGRAAGRDWRGGRPAKPGWPWNTCHALHMVSSVCSAPTARCHATSGLLPYTEVA
jgi:hypothetical protein